MTPNSKEGHQYDSTVNHGHLHQGNSYNNHYFSPNDPKAVLQRKVAACQNALFLTNPYVDLETLRTDKGKKVDGTCEWIRDNEVFQSWLLGNSGPGIWITGGPGKGKTMLSIFLVEELDKHIGRDVVTEGKQQKHLLFYFCDNRRQDRSHAAAVLRSLVYQLVMKYPDLLTEAILSHYFDGAEKTQATVASPEALWIVLRGLLQGLSDSTVFCVLDGLDECDDASSDFLAGKFCDLYSSTDSLGTYGGCRFKSVIVSRRMDGTGLHTLPRVQLDPDNDDYVNSDIRKCISSGLSQLSRVPGFNQDIRSKVESTLLDRSGGTFLWVGLVLQELSKIATCTELIETLDSMPLGLPAIYRRMLLQTKGRQRHVVSQILRWATIAVRPLTLDELAAATCVACTEFVSIEQTMRDHVTWCGPILTLQGQTVGLVHQSAKDYLLRKEQDDNPELGEFRFNLDETHSKVANLCILCMEDSHLQLASFEVQDASQAIRRTPLLGYAVQHWDEHARCCPPEYSDELFNLLRPFFQDRSVVRANWWKIYQEHNREEASLLGVEGIDLTPPLLHIASFFGIDLLIMRLIFQETAIPQSWKRFYETGSFPQGITPTIEAHAVKQRASQLLFRHDTENNAVGIYDSKPLYIASILDHEATVRLLIAVGAKVDHQYEDGQTLFMVFAVAGQKAMAQILLENGANVNHCETSGYTTLSYSIIHGEKDILQLLLNNGADANHQDPEGLTPLLCSIISGQKEMVQLLLNNGADINHEGPEHRTPLLHAIVWGHREIVQLLLNNGADINHEGPEHLTPLLNAIVWGHREIVQLLLNNGADINHQDPEGLTPLLCSIITGQKEVVQLLLDNGADINHRSPNDQPPIMYAVLHEQKEMVQLLSDHGADVNYQSPRGLTPLLYSISTGRKEVVQLLLDNGADIDHRSPNGKTPIQQAVEWGQKGLVQLLVNNGADILTSQPF